MLRPGFALLVVQRRTKRHWKEAAGHLGRHMTAVYVPTEAMCAYVDSWRHGW